MIRSASTTFSIRTLLLWLFVAVLPTITEAQPADKFAPLLDRADELAPLNSLIIYQKGEIVAERYYRGMKADKAVNMKSVSKTLLSPLVGIAMRDGLLEGPDQKIADFLPEYYAEIDDAHRNQITLRDVLSMTTGLEGTSFGTYGAWVASKDWVKYALDRDIACEIGACMTYSTGNTHLISVILSRASGKNLRSYAREAFFRKLGIPMHKWDQDPQGYYLGGNNMALRPRDMLRFGQVFLNKGRYKGEQLVPAEWIEISWEPRTISPWNGHRYGYLWWSRVFGGEQTYFAWGYGGQYIFILPELESIVIVTSSLRNRPRGVDHNQAVQQFLSEEIIPTLRASGDR
ncbi:MAG: serine hydrolase [Bacteroidota bacterium]